MTDILDHYQGKLYDKEGIEHWDLPDSIKNQIEYDDYDYFFLASSKAEKHGQRHLHLSIYPIKFNIVYLLEIETPIINPRLMRSTLEHLRKKEFDIITSTGFCTHKELCHFGIYLSVPSQINTEDLISEIKKIEKVSNATIYTYSCEGCSKT